MGLIEDYRSHKVKFFQTAALCFAYVTLGFGIAIIGPTMIDLGIAVNSSTAELSYLLASRALGTLISCLLTNFHRKYFGFIKIIAISQFIMGITLFILPLNTSIIGMNITIFVYGYASGCFQVFGDLWTMRIWNKKQAAIYIQWIYFFFSGGAFVAPLLAAPFLLVQKDSNTVSMNNQNFNSSSNNSSLQQSEIYTREDLKIMYPYMIIGVYACILTFILYSLNNLNQTNQKTSVSFNETSKSSSSQSTSSNICSDEKTSLIKTKTSSLTDSINASCEYDQLNKPNFFLIKVLSILFVNIFIGFDVTFGTYLSVFVYKNNDLRLSTQEGAYITAAFWGAYTFAFRIPGYYIIQNYGPTTLLNIEMIITFFSTILLIFSTKTISLMWLSVILEGLGMSIVYSTYLAFLKTNFEPSAKLCSAFVCAFCFGTFIYPFVTGFFIEENPQIFIYLSVFCCFATTLIYIYVRFLFRKWK